MTLSRIFMRIAAVAVVIFTCAPRVSVAADGAVTPRYPDVVSGTTLRFPVDHGAHPDFRTEWWYVTGWLNTPDGRPLGFQVTFFRSRPEIDQRNPSTFAPKQILFAHAAISDPAMGKLMHDQRVARAGFGLAETSTADTDIKIGDWSLKRGADDQFRAQVRGKEFTFDITLSPPQSPLLQGEYGYSRKGPAVTQASYYYSLPHLKVSGSVKRGARTEAVTGSAWLDHEWSSRLLDPRAVGWDWVGLNLDDGRALMAFQIRDAAGDVVWAGGSLRSKSGESISFAPDQVRFTTQRVWRSPRTAARYPVERTLSVRLPAGERVWRIVPLFDDQELDSRPSGGPVYWEGAVRVDGGQGYLELTGYLQPLKL